ncbi:palmitoyl-protein thioesterase ABHD10, mitochondrial-like isoform X1 [Stegostoma tigrinum]|uniref:palmitoyl-protein thioesterase ABHD10, mitochondrial-like isoform X1 n=1 Tax=Stegostoma tigrinum TaxID=3053191 RepID=UPI00202B7C93|nr:palmitoyl-protein thioesterase ABHD10, mitochondrial-like isoform X1 [Stegostoma tigrinum]
MNIQCPFPFAPLGVMAAAVLRRLPGLIAVGSSALWRPVPWPHAVGCCKKSTKYLARPDQPKLAYKKIKGRSPGVIFLPGFASTMKAQKGLELEDFCKSLGHSFIRFDYSGCGASEGKFSESTIGQWKKDVLAVLDELSEGPQVLVGSSMGGWLMLLAAIARPDKIAALIGIATGADYLINAFKQLPLETQKEIEAKGEWYLPNLQKGSEFHKIPYTFLKDAENHRVLHSTIPITCPVRLIHGMKDDHIPWQISLNVAQNVLSSDVDLILRKHGQHRMAEKDDVKLIVNIIDDVIDKLRTMA